MERQDTMQAAELQGLSTETKPTTGVAAGATFYELDTKKYYVYSPENETWYEM